MAVHILTHLTTAFVTSGINVLFELTYIFCLPRQAPSEYAINVWVWLVATLHSESEYSTRSTEDDVAVMSLYLFASMREHLFNAEKVVTSGVLHEESLYLASAMNPVNVAPKVGDATGDPIGDLVGDNSSRASFFVSTKDAEEL